MINCSVFCFRPPSNEVSHSSFEPFRYKFYARSPFQCQLFAQHVVNTHKYIWIANSFNTSCIENHQTQPKVLFINLCGSTFFIPATCDILSLFLQYMFDKYRSFSNVKSLQYYDLLSMPLQNISKLHFFIDDANHVHINLKSFIDICSPFHAIIYVSYLLLIHIRKQLSLLLYDDGV